MELRRGDIVWARVLYPIKWWPGLVLSTDSIGVAVSFFDDGKNPRYFPEKEVCFFQENFDSLAQTLENCDKGKELLDKALKLLVRRAVSSLKCTCHFRLPQQGDTISRWSKRKRRRRGRGDSFQSNAVLGFVLGVAVSPFVGVLDSVFALTSIAQLNVFRSCLVSEQILFLQQEKARQHHKRNCSICLSPSLSSGARKSDVSEVEFDEPLNEDQTNKGSWIRIEQIRSQSLHGLLVNLHKLALDTNYIRGECLNSVKQNFLMLRNCMYQNTLNLRFKKCSPRSTEAQFSHPPSYSEPSDKVGEKYCKDASNPRKHNMSSNVNFLGLSRRHDCPVDSGFSFKMAKTLPHLSINVDAYLRKSKHGCNGHVLDALTSGPALSHLFLKFCNTIPFSIFNGTVAHLQVDRTRCEANISDTFFSGSQLEVFIIDDASSRTETCLPSPHSKCQVQMQPSNDYNEMYVKTNKSLSISTGFRDSSMANNKLYLPVTPDVSFKPQLAQESLGNISNCRRLLMKFPKDFNLPSKEELLREFSQFGKVNSSRTKIFTRTGSAQVVFINQTDTLAAYHHAKRKKGLFGEINMLLWFDPYENKRRGSKFVIHSPNQKSSPRARNYPPSTHTTNQMQMQPSCDDREACVETNENLSINATFRGSSMGNKGFLQLITTDVSFKPQVSKQSSIGTFSNCQHLRMKFPKDFNLPSKKDLIGKFRRFGKIDLFRTKIFTHMGSAQVVFLHHLDAVCAYQYAKRKKDLFGEANILFWLDRCEKKRRGSKLVVPMPNLKSCLKHTDYLDLHGQKDKKCPLPKPKSCVKISDLHMQEDKKSKKRPWFSIEAPLPDLKSCLRKSDLHGQEDKKCTKRVRFLMET